jgi:acetyl esterase/lipase
MLSRQVTLSLIAALALSACTGPQLLNTLATGTERPGEIVTDIQYGDDSRQVLDLYRPRGDGPFPVLVFVHGGSWQTGDKGPYAFAGRRFAEEGYLTAVISYRLVPDVRYPAFVEDTAAAIAKTRAIAADYQGDPERMFLVGHSAGAYNVVQAALADGFLAPVGLSAGDIGAVAGLSGPYDFLPLDPGAAQAAFGGAPDLPATQPINHVDADDPPVLLITGDADTVVRPRNSRVLAEAMRAAGGTAELRVYEGAGHNLPLIAIARPGRGDTVADVTQFFARFGGSGSAAP